MLGPAHPTLYAPRYLTAERRPYRRVVQYLLVWKKKKGRARGSGAAASLLQLLLLLQLF